MSDAVSSMVLAPGQRKSVDMPESVARRTAEYRPAFGAVDTAAALQQTIQRLQKDRATQNQMNGNLNVDINVNQDGKVVSTTATPGRAQGTRFNLQTRTNP